MTYPVRTQARALLIDAGRIALIRIAKNGSERWVLPGGGQDAGESLTETVRRECREELGIQVTVGPLCLVREFVPDNHDLSTLPFRAQCIDFVFRCTPAGATTLHLGHQPDDEAVEARWVTFAAAQALPLYPAALTTWLPQLLTTGSEHGADEGIRYLGDVP